MVKMSVLRTLAASVLGLAVAVVSLGAIADDGASLSSSEIKKKYAKHAHGHHWHFGGPFGSFDQAQLQRGLQVYREVCSACHGITRIAFRNLEALGYSPEQVKALAAEYTVEDGPNDDGDMFTRPAIASDYFPPAFPNEQIARLANNGALPPDLSLITKARHSGTDYIYALLNGYEEPPADVDVPDGQYYNPYFHSVLISMAQPLYEGQVDYADGTSNSLPQMAEDVTAFLTWAAEPSLVERKQLGLGVLAFLAVLIVVTYRSYKQVWKPVKEGQTVLEDDV